MRFSTMTLGCKANQYDTGTIEGILRGRGHEHVKVGDGCDVCIINTCAVTAEAVRKSRQAIRRIKNREPDALIAVCGCYSKLESAAAEALGADLVGGTDDREGFAAKIVGATVPGRPRTPAAAPPTPPPAGATRVPPPIVGDAPLRVPPPPRTRALLKIQDGCDNQCAYCIIPQARGKSRSTPLNELAAKAKALDEQGYKEIVVTGIEISSYSPSLIAALQTISTHAPHTRLRLGSLMPEILTAGFAEQLKGISNLCNHFHISLQSGCDEVLSNMRRNYKAEDVLCAIGRLRGAFDNCGVTADLIVGFPGETDAQFEQTLRFIEKAAFSAMHIFPYSPRPGIPAAKMPGQISGTAKKERAKIAAETAAHLAEKFKLAQIGKTLDVLFETQKVGYSIGHSGNYLSVAVRMQNGNHVIMHKNTLENVKILGITDSALFGEIV